MIDRGNVLPLTRQASLLRLSRSSVYYLPRPVPPARLVIMRRIDELHLEYPFAGSRMLRDLLRREGITIGRLAVATLMRRMSFKALCVRRVRFVMISPDPRQHRRCQAGTPLIKLSEFPEPPLSGYCVALFAGAWIETQRSRAGQTTPRQSLPSRWRGSK